MPLYEYHCDACARQFELIRKFSDPPLDACPHCGGKVRKLFSSPAIQFKGSGFYITDYAKKDSTSPSPSSDGQSEPASKESKEKGTGEKKGGEGGEKTEKSERSEKREKGEKAGKDDKASTKTDSTPAAPSKTPAAKDGT